ncbi:hypothetical protein D3C75_1217870 [compost metagenome]
MQPFRSMNSLKPLGQIALYIAEAISYKLGRNVGSGNRYPEYQSKNGEHNRVAP